MKISFGVLLSAATLVSTSLAGPVRLVERQREPFNLTVDDGNSYLKYEEDGWIHLTNQGSQWKDGTESYTDNPNG